jgi:Putative zinc-finger
VSSRLGGPNQPEPDDDPFAEYDAAYVFGALAPDDRAAYERHLQHCDNCSAAVAAMAGVPGLLSRVPLDRVIGTDHDAPLPDTLLPRLVAEVARERTRSRWRVGAAAALAAACVLGLLVALLVNQRPGRSTADGPVSPGTTSVTSSGPSSGPLSTAQTGSGASVGPELTMAAVGAQAGVTASVQFQSVLWGTRITLKCHEAGSGAQQPYAGLYYLVVVGRDKSRHPVAEWRSLAGKTVHIEGDTGLQRVDIASVQVLDADRDVILRLPL